MSANDQRATIHIEGACTHNLRDVSLHIPHHALTVVTGVSGAGKSSLVFDTLYAEGQRRYVETFSPYSRQFLERLDKPPVKRIENILPAIAIARGSHIKTARSTVATLTGLADCFKLLYARASQLYCQQCQAPVQPEYAEHIVEHLLAPANKSADVCLIVFAVPVPAGFEAEQIRDLLNQQGYSRIHRQYSAGDGSEVLEVVQDRLRLAKAEPKRLREAVDAALLRGKGHLSALTLEADGNEKTRQHFSSRLHCAPCDLDYSAATPGLFSFNSAIGACPTCRGFGRIIGFDAALVLPDSSKTLAQGAVKPWQTKAFAECQRDLLHMAAQYGVPTDVPLHQLSAEHRRWLLEGDPHWQSWKKSWPAKWYGIRHFFDWLESKAYKMHIRVLLSRYRGYHVCPDCHGSRLKAGALNWRLGAARLSITELMALPLAAVREYIGQLRDTTSAQPQLQRLIDETCQRLDYLCEVGLGYLTPDRQARTLSGGELQRINLTSALAAALVNTLFVFDEPSAGLHAQDAKGIIKIMHKLRDAGNTLVVVENNHDFLRAADWLVELGPGAGSNGGQIVAADTPARLADAALHPDSLSGACLDQRHRIQRPASAKRPAAKPQSHLTLHNIQRHNLHQLTVDIPLDRLTVLAGVSGSGKSTLLAEVLHPALLQHFQQDGAAPDDTPDETPEDAAGSGESTAAASRLSLHNAEHFKRVVLVDQSPIGKSARACPATHVGAWTPIRRLFAALPQARERGYTLGSFSFNSGQGRCAGCGGSGFEHIEMQFLADVWLRCPDCDGRRYRTEILEVRLNDKSIADVLAMTVHEAMQFFAGHSAVLNALEPLAAVGLDYISLGQPTPTLSGGEAQRLKLAAHLPAASSADPKKTAPRCVFLFDEPTIGLHDADIGRLLAVLSRLQAEGHALIVIEHNLDLIANADWLIELGPGAGADGGRIVAAGTPQTLASMADSPTGAALRALQRPRTARLAAEPPMRYGAADGDGQTGHIHLQGAREHNLKNIALDLPHKRLNVITGLSGSGKSTLAFDVIFGEGQRRWLESLSPYVRQFIQPGARAEIDRLDGIAPTVAIEQRTSRGGRKSTLATLAEIHPFLRLLYARLGTQYCPHCDIAVVPQSFDAINGQILQHYQGREITILAPLVSARKGLYATLARKMAAQGFDQLYVDGNWQPTRPWPRLDRYQVHDIALPLDSLQAGDDERERLRTAVQQGLQHGKGVIQVLDHAADENAPLAVFSMHRACPRCACNFAEPDPRHFSWHNRSGWCPACYGSGELENTKKLDPYAPDSLEAIAEKPPCPLCNGARLNAVSRAVRFGEHSLPAVCAWSIAQAHAFFSDLKLAPREQALARDLVDEICARLRFLLSVGLDYLSLDRAAPTLSGGEAQRIRLAAQLGSNLRGVCYVLDEPTIGLHARDNARLVQTLLALRDEGNTVLVVEHDEAVIRAADHIVDLGPGAGVEGGHIIASGSLGEILANPASVTGAALNTPCTLAPAAQGKGRAGADTLSLGGAQRHNIDGLDVDFPLSRLVVLSGVSGSGKSTLARDILLPNLHKLLTSKKGAVTLQHCQRLDGWQKLQRVLEVDQTPIGKTPRSCPATYVGCWDAIRKLLAGTVQARTRGFNAAHFSFNTGSGRCPVCQGQGQINLEMHFLPDVKTPCEACGGSRFTADARTIVWRGHNVADLLAMQIVHAAGLFADHPPIARPLRLLTEAGLGYLTLGQPSPTLSGGEAQRLKLVAELSKAEAGKASTLYILDEPSVGLHKADVSRLLAIFRRLVAAGHSLLVIEHDLDIIAAADWIIDLGPEGGAAGGQIVASGTPRQIIRRSHSHTAAALQEHVSIS